MEDTVIGLCAAGIGCALLEHLSPDGTMKRTFSLLVALLFFGCFLSPLSSLFRVAGGWIAQAKAPVTVPAELNEEVGQQIVSVLEEAMRTDAEQRTGLTVRRVRIQRDIAHEDSIYIERADVVFAQKEHPVSAEVRQRLEQAWGIVLEVYYAE